MIISCGEALIDFVPHAVTKEGQKMLLSPCVGGSPYNFAVAASRLEAPTGFLGKISRDFFGDVLYENLKMEKVDTRYVQRSELPSTLAFVKLDDNAEPRYAFYAENSSDRSLIFDDIPENIPESVHCIAFGSIALLLEPLSSTIRSLAKREAGKRVLSFDPNIRPNLVKDRTGYTALVEEMVGISSIVKVSQADLEWLYPDNSAEKSAAQWSSIGNNQLLVMTCGKDGAVLFKNDYRVEVSAEAIEVKDSIGAGDTFHAAFLARLLHRNRLSPCGITELGKEEAQDALRFAVRAAGINCTREGADPPRASEMSNLF